jgi:hypothetical protein
MAFFCVYFKELNCYIIEPLSEKAPSGASAGKTENSSLGVPVN